jgi:hypothetical protein
MAEKPGQVVVDDRTEALARREGALKAKLALALCVLLGVRLSTDGDVLVGGINAAGLGVRAHDDGGDCAEQGLADDLGAPFVLPRSELELGATVGAGDDRHRAVRGGDQSPDEPEHLVWRDVQLRADLGGPVDDHLDPDSPREQHVFDRDSLSGSCLPNRSQPRELLVGDGLVAGAGGHQRGVEIDEEAPAELPIRDQPVGGKLGADLLADALGQ